MKKNILIISAIICIALSVSAQTWPSQSIQTKPGSRWWWLGSALTQKDVSWNMQQYSLHGIGTLEITPLYGVQGNDKNNIPFLSPQWMQMLKYIEQEGLKDSIEIDMNCGTGWPFGGPAVPINEAACKVVYNDLIVNDKDCKNLDINIKDEKERNYAFLERVMAYPIDVKRYKGPAAINITEFSRDGKLNWKAPKKGTWRIISLYASRTLQKVKRAAPGGEGYVIDHFDSLAVAHYLDRFEKAFENNNVPYPHTFFNDSYEVYKADWTPTLLKEFEKRRGYKLEDHLPELLGDIKDDNKVLSDYRETLSDLLINNFTNQWTAWAHSHGVITRNQAHGSPANLIDTYAAVDIPEIEGFGLTNFGIKGLRNDPGNTRPNYSDLSMLKYAPSASHITGKRLTSSETFTWLTEHFRTSLSQCKPDMDLMFVAGVNHMFFHGTCYSPQNDPWPGWKFYASIDMSPTNSIWRDAPYFMQYINRCQSFLQWGEPDNDFLVYLPVRDMWRERSKELLMQFSIETMAKRAPEFIKSILNLNNLGYDCDYISDKYLLSTDYINGMLQTAAGTRYKGLIIPAKTLPSDVKAHIEKLKIQGAHIIYGCNNKEELEQSARPEVMKTELGLKTIRRRNDKGYHYFISNLTPNDVNSYVDLAINFNCAIWFNPINGEQYAAEINDGKVKIVLKSGESLILETFDKPTRINLPIRKTQMTNPREINKGWKLSFIEEHPVVNKTFKIDSLRTWETLEDDSVKETMGTGVYTTTINMSKIEANKNYAIDLGDVRESARVYINGNFIGCAWSVPFILNCKKAFKAGINTLRIEVTNLPANRIAAMDRKGIKWRKFNEINFVDINYKKTSYADWQPVKSGLNGKVILYELK